MLSEAPVADQVTDPPSTPLHADSLALAAYDVSKTYRRYEYRPATFKAWAIDAFRRRAAKFVEFPALQGVSFEIPRGQMVALIGRNGAGKTTLLRILADLIPPDSGRVAVQGRLGPLLALGAGFTPDLTGRQNIYLYGSLLGLRRKDVTARLESIIEFSGIRDFIDSPVKHYSSGMYVRLAFAVVAHMDPEILLLDEVLTVGDAEFQAKCLAHITDFRRRGGTIVLVTHAIGAGVEMCDRALLLDHGVLVDDGPPSNVYARYQRMVAERGVAE